MNRGVADSTLANVRLQPSIAISAVMRPRTAVLWVPLVFAYWTAIGLRAWFARMPWKRGHSPLTLVPEYEDYLFEQWSQGTFNEFWRQP